MGPIDVHDHERLARERLSPGAWAYYSGGADDEVALREELELAMVLAGVPGVEGIGPDLLWKG